MKRKHKVVIITISILFVLGICIGLSYAYYMARGTQENSNAITGECFKLSFTDNNDITISKGIPMSDSAASSLVPYEFKVKNICNINANFDINLETLNTSTMDIAAIKYKLDDLDPNNLANTEENDSSEFVNDNAKSSNKIHTDSLLSGEEKTFYLRLWIDKNSTIEQAADKIFKSKIVIKASMIYEGEIAILDDGPIVNNKLIKLGNKSMIDTEILDDFVVDINFSIVNIQRSLEKPAEGTEYIHLEDEESIQPIYAWMEMDTSSTVEYTSHGSLKTSQAYPCTIYIYSPEEKIYMNPNSSHLFSTLFNLNNIDLSYFDTSRVTNMNGMFDSLEKITSLDVSNFDTSKVTDMSEMFARLKSITSLDLSNFDTSNVTNMYNMFCVTYNITSLDLSNFNTNNVTDMEGMFSYMYDLTSLDISSFNTSKVTSMKYMFNGDRELTSLDVSGFDTSNVTDMYGMFYSLSKIETLDLSNFNTSNVTDMSAMFSNMSHLTNLDISNFNTSKVEEMSSMFSSCSNLTELDLSNFNTSKVTDMSWMFSSMRNVKTIYVGNEWNTSNVTSSKSMFNYANQLTGSAGTKYSSSHIDVSYAHVDGGTSNPGYFTLKTN